MGKLEEPFRAICGPGLDFDDSCGVSSSQAEQRSSGGCKPPEGPYADLVIDISLCASPMVAPTIRHAENLSFRFFVYYFEHGIQPYAKCQAIQL